MLLRQILCLDSRLDTLAVELTHAKGVKLNKRNPILITKAFFA